MTALLVALGACVLGAIASVVGPGSFGRAAGFALLGVAGGAACVAAAAALRAAAPAIAGSSGLHVLLRLDPTAGVFIGIVGIVCALVAIFALGPRTRDERRSGRTAAASACAIAFACFLVCAADDVLFFIFAWELLALTFYWAVAYAGTDPRAPRAAYLTVVIAHAAGACIVAALLALAHGSHDYRIDAVAAAGRSLGSAGAGIVLVLLLIGFGAKFGMFPMHAWLPYGYRAAPSVVAALMAGGALNVGFYGIVRFVVGFPGAPEWFAVLAIGVGAVSAFLGIAWACGQNDLRRLAAYSSVENGGIVLAALGVAIAGKTLGIGMLTGFAIAAAYVQIFAHAVSKSTLFLVASTIHDRCDGADLNLLGGLSRSMPVVTLAALACGLSLAALPPLAGFIGEWMVLEVLMQAFRTGNAAYEVSFALAGALIGVAAGVAVVTFTKLIGIGLLGAPRTRAAAATQTRSRWQLAGLLLGVAAIVAGGMAATPLLALAAPSVDAIAGAPAVRAIVGTFPLIQPAFAGFSSASALALGCLIAAFALGFRVLTLALRAPEAPRERAEVWTSGNAYRARTQYTATGYANATRVILDAGVRTLREVAAQAPGDPSHPGYRSEVRPFFDLPFYRRLQAAAFRVSDAVRATQSGAIGTYLSYILIFTILLLVLYPSIRHW